MNKTFMPKDYLQQRKWQVIDASGVVLGRLAVQIANILRGRNKAIYTPHLDTGDFVVVINAEKMIVTGKKEDEKTYMFYSGWRGGESFRKLKKLRQTKPEWIIWHAVKGMLPQNRMGKKLITKLKIYSGPEHPHTAQKPSTLTPAK
ncbi:MAG: 50S ribosomal protein L13 [Verrucomicrobia bacterium]|jgi:large subunit ribosomal protein L13|nr:50S ribosomal protein L13 [Verrucomicrobiota bacterium]MBO6004295.1 50S ribosomal protein L13 [Verrucomicrobiota bacterium]MBO7392151.1 50S ribosomal protein L13 [Verrucomicrobiota bacterium]MBP5760173.1 50S ribosomal protein L13 [Verrucomicrobiota bacterium]MBQ7589996.1 50S ribosomal protein L13 [Verrucomicrobiota bacterium]